LEVLEEVVDEEEEEDDEEEEEEDCDRLRLPALSRQAPSKPTT
jgi:hypothetical protein